MTTPTPDPAAVRHIALAEIDADALTRDRTAHDPAALAELQTAIRIHGLRQPIEVFAFADPVPSRDGPTRLYGLISGWRRLASVRALDAEGFPGFTTIPAFLRAPASFEAALVAMVEENEVRADLSPWEKGRVVVQARNSEVFATLDEAVDKLYPAADRNKRTRLRRLAHLVDELDGCLAAPETLSQRNALRLAEACQRGYADLIHATLAEAPRRAPHGVQWELLAPILAEMEATRRDGPSQPGRPRRVSTPRPTLKIRREKTRGGYTLHFTGQSATSNLLDAVFDEIDRIFSPG